MVSSHEIVLHHKDGKSSAQVRRFLKKYLYIYLIKSVWCVCWGLSHLIFVVNRSVMIVGVGEYAIDASANGTELLQRSLPYADPK